MYTINGLQSVCDVLFEHPSWTIAHLVAFFNLKEHLNHPKLADIIDEPDFETSMTPIQVSDCFSHKRRHFNKSCFNLYLLYFKVLCQPLGHITKCDVFDFVIYAQKS